MQIDTEEFFSCPNPTNYHQGFYVIRDGTEHGVSHCIRVKMVTGIGQCVKNENSFGTTAVTDKS